MWVSRCVTIRPSISVMDQSIPTAHSHYNPPVAVTIRGGLVNSCIEGLFNLALVSLPPTNQNFQKVKRVMISIPVPLSPGL